MIDESRFRDADTRRLFFGERVRRYPAALAQRTQNKLKIVYAASRLEDLAIPPGNRLEALKGDRRGQWSIRASEQWRICFIWDGTKTVAIEVVDYIEGIMAKRKIRPVHPGRILFEEFMEPAGISQYRLAQATGLSQMQIGNIIRGRRSISAETALRLERALGMSAQTWMNLQMLYDLEKATLESGTEIRKTTERLNLRQAA